MEIKNPLDSQDIIDVQDIEQEGQNMLFNKTPENIVTPEIIKSLNARFIEYSELTEITKSRINIGPSLDRNKYFLIYSLSDELKKSEKDLRADIVYGTEIFESDKIVPTSRTMDGSYVNIGDITYDYNFNIRHYADMRTYSTTNQGMPRYEFLLSDLTILKLYFEVGPEKIIFQDNLAEMKFKAGLAKIKILLNRARDMANYKINGVIPELPDTYVVHPNPNLRLSPYQEAAISFLYPCSGAAFMEQGTGKTPIAVNLMSCIGRKITRDLNRFATVLVICPQNIQQNWVEEILRFATGPAKVTLCRGDQLYRTKLLVLSLKDNKGKIFTALVMSYDTAVSDINNLRMIHWDLIIADESQFFKSAATKRWEAIEQLIERSSHRIDLTGTPFANNISDLYTQLEFIDHGVSGFSSLNAFKKFYSTNSSFVSRPGEEESAVEKLVGAKNLPTIQDIMSRYAVVISKKEAGLQLPDKVSGQIISVDMTKDQRGLYKAIADQLMAEITNELNDSTKTITANHILTKLLRLAQITSGVVRWDAKFDEEGDMIEDGETTYIHSNLWDNPKIAALFEDWLSEDRSKNEKAIIWATFVPNIWQLQEACKQKGIDCVTYYGKTSFTERNEAERRFNEDPNCRIFIGNPKSAAVGLNLLGYDHHNPAGPQLDTYTSRVYYYSSNWSHLERAQSEDRAHRRGTRMPVSIIDIVVPGSIDMQIRKVVQNKRESGEIIKDLKDILKEIVNIY